jgi:DDB1- and CUL4-associated factor 13
MFEARKVKEDRRRKHTREGEQKPKPERRKVVLKEME